MPTPASRKTPRSRFARCGGEAIHAATEPYSADGRYSLWIMSGMVAICALWLTGATLLDRARQRSARWADYQTARMAALSALFAVLGTTYGAADGTRAQIPPAAAGLGTARVRSLPSLA